MKNINEYLNLTDTQKNTSLLPDLQELKEYYYNNKDYVNYFKTLLFLIDIYNNEEKFDDALEVCNHMSSVINKNDYPQEYKSLLDQYVYVFITKQYYQRALSYCLMKKEYIDVKNNNEVNRWYLELAYIHEAIGEKNDALMKLTSILENDPDDETKAYCLNNITKLFVDESNLDEAKVYLDKCLNFVTMINDIEGVRYCDYLKGKIYHLENNYKESYRIFSSMFRNITKIEVDNFTYLNEYLSLLIDMTEYNYGIQICEKFYDEVNKSYDLQNKLLFYRNCLKLDVANANINLRKKKSSKIDSASLLDKISILEEEIIDNKDIKLNEIKNDEISFELKLTEEKNTGKLIELLEEISFNNEEGNIRKYLMNYSTTLTNKLPMQEIVIALFNKNTKTIISTIPTGIDNGLINVFNYKNNRLYERNFKYEDIINTLLEKVIETKQEISLDINDFNNHNNNYLDIITKLEYDKTGVKYVYCLPLVNNDNLYGTIIYSSINNNILSSQNKLSLSIITRLFEVNLVNLLYNESIITQTGILASTTNQLKLGSFYIINETKTIILSKELKNLLQINKSIISEEDYSKLIYKGDLETYLTKFDSIANSVSYVIDYHLVINDEVILVHEQASPFVNPKNELYYCGTIEKILINDIIIKEIDNTRLQNKNDLFKRLELLKKKSFMGIVYHFPTLDNKDIDILFKILKNIYNNIIYFDSNRFFIINENDIKKEKEVLKLSKEFFNQLKTESINDIKYNEQDIIYTIIISPDVLVRSDDFYDVSIFVTSVCDNSNYIKFNNEIYARYISVNTITSCVTKAIMNKNIEVFGKELLINYQSIGYSLFPVIKGVYNQDSLKVVSKDLLTKLDELVVDIMNKKDYVCYYSLDSTSLVSIINKNLLNEESRFIFNLQDKDLININYIIKRLWKTKCRLVINCYHLNNINLESLKKYSKVIIGFNDSLDDNNEINEMIEVFKKFNDKYFMFTDNNIIKIKSDSKKLN